MKFAICYELWNAKILEWPRQSQDAYSQPYGGLASGAPSPKRSLQLLGCHRQVLSASTENVGTELLRLRFSRQLRGQMGGSRQMLPIPDGQGSSYVVERITWRRPCSCSRVLSLAKPSKSLVLVSMKIARDNVRGEHGKGRILPDNNALAERVV
jgi:hypothetical protein